MVAFPIRPQHSFVREVRSNGISGDGVGLIDGRSVHSARNMWITIDVIVRRLAARNVCEWKQSSTFLPRLAVHDALTDFWGEVGTCFNHTHYVPIFQVQSVFFCDINSSDYFSGENELKGRLEWWVAFRCWGSSRRRLNAWMKMSLSEERKKNRNKNTDQF